MQKYKGPTTDKSGRSIRATLIAIRKAISDIREIYSLIDAGLIELKKKYIKKKNLS